VFDRLDPVNLVRLFQRTGQHRDLHGCGGQLSRESRPQHVFHKRLACSYICQASTSLPAVNADIRQLTRSRRPLLLYGYTRTGILEVVSQSAQFGVQFLSKSHRLVDSLSCVCFLGDVSLLLSSSSGRPPLTCTCIQVFPDPNSSDVGDNQASNAAAERSSRPASQPCAPPESHASKLGACTNSIRRTISNNHTTDTPASLSSPTSQCMTGETPTRSLEASTVTRVAKRRLYRSSWRLTSA